MSDAGILDSPFRIPQSAILPRKGPPLSPKSNVALVACDSYDPVAVLNACRKGIDLLGGPGTFARKGERIVLKPNILIPSHPDKCIVTHPSLIRAAALIFRETEAHISFGDSPGGGFIPTGLVLRQCGYADLAKECSLAVADFDHGRMIDHPSGISSKKLLLARAVIESDGLISISKLKTHGLVRFTGAVKNQFGCVPGMTKGEYHARFPDVNDFAGMLADITACVKPRLYIMDGIIAMEGNGPQGGDPKKLGVLLFSTDPVAIDAVACRIIDLDPAFVPTCEAGRRAGLGSYAAGKITIVGDPIESFIDKSFVAVRRPPVSVTPNKLIALVKKMIIRRPFIRSGKCTKCGSCIKACPVDPKAIAWTKKAGRRPPAYRYQSCIRCFCCQEMCPSGAIHIHTPLLGKLLPPLSFIVLLVVKKMARKEREENSESPR